MPKQFGLVVDHSRLQPVVEIKQPPSHPSVPDPNRLPKLSHACDSFIERMRQSNSRASMLVGSAEAQASLAECITSTAVSSLPASSGSSSGFASIDAYRKTLGDPLLLTVNRWPAARFVSALEQFSLPTRLGLPCSKVKRMEGGECHGHTCERDFAYSWRCLNESATRTGMLAVHMRCLQARPKSLVEGTEAQIDALRVMEESLAKDGSGGDAASAEALRNARELLVERAKKAAATGHVSRGKVPTVDGVKVDRMPGCGNKWNDRISDARYVQDAVANTLGWPPGGAQPSGLELLTKNPTPLFDGWKNMLTQTGGDEFAFRYLGAIARHFDLVLVNEYMDESLLLLAKREKWPLRDILYLSQSGAKGWASPWTRLRRRPPCLPMPSGRRGTCLRPSCCVSQTRPGCGPTSWTRSSARTGSTPCCTCTKTTLFGGSLTRRGQRMTTVPRSGGILPSTAGNWRRWNDPALAASVLGRWVASSARGARRGTRRHTFAGSYARHHVVDGALLLRSAMRFDATAAHEGDQCLRGGAIGEGGNL